MGGRARGIRGSGVSYRDVRSEGDNGDGKGRRVGEERRGGVRKRTGRDERVRRGPRRRGTWKMKGTPVLRLGGVMMMRRGARGEGRRRRDGERG